MAQNRYGNETATLTYYATGTVDYTESDVTDVPSGGGGGDSPHPINMGLLIFMYVTVFILAVVGNILVIMTLVHNKRMRTVTNVFLFSLAVSDVLFAIMCIPFTLVGNILQRFIFGAGVCKIVPYFQGVSVTVSVWTMVAISLERYHAICNPLSSRIWQTKRHAYRAIAAVWILGFLLFIPTIVFTKLIPLNEEDYMCREVWPHEIFKKVILTSIFVILMVIPLLTMAIAYGLIIFELRQGMVSEKRVTKSEKEENGTPLSENITKLGDTEDSAMMTTSGAVAKKTKIKESRHVARSTSTSDAKKRVVKMLIVIVILFFICWSPSWCLLMWSVYDEINAFTKISPVEIAFVKWMTYVSACVNPIVYCFMNKKFRQGFLEAFGCCGVKREKVPNNTFVSGGDSRYQSTRRQTEVCSV
ncbi:cholecystokinin receptor-like isoform X2 [Amphiura filiformis]|uniref:cholecystokinin receptor-like isoform X2 n=1 Tax=Amphiura filiformis TaxID=82378 RepID=UPI003B218D3B